MAKQVSDCPCGMQHAIASKSQFLRVASPTILVGSRDGAWRVPRIFVAIHQVPTPTALPGLAAEFGWEKVA